MPRVRSLRGRVLAWYSAILVMVVAASGAMVCVGAWRVAIAGLDADLDARAAELIRALRPVEGGTFDLDLPPDLQSRPGEGRTDYAIFSATGELVDRSDPDRPVSKPEGEFRRTRDGRRERALVSASGVTVIVSREAGPALQRVWATAGAVGLAGLVTVALSLAGGRWIVGRALAPIDRIGGTARAMTGGDRAARIDLTRLERELGEVAGALNDAFDRLNGLIEQEKRFTADASHELRTPLATMGAEIEWALASDRSPDDYRAALGVCRRAASRMQRTVTTLLTLSRADAGDVRLQRAPVRLDAVVQEALALVRPLAEQRGVRIDETAEPVTVSGDADRLVEAISNVLANAVQYNQAAGLVGVRVSREGASARVDVEDTGIGIAAADLPHIFERFYRADPARSSDPGGAGLGLAWTRWIVEAHDGRITASSEPGRGTTVTVRLPLQA